MTRAFVSSGDCAHHGYDLPDVKVSVGPTVDPASSWREQSASIAGPRPRDDVEALKGDLASVLTKTKLRRRLVESLEGSIDLRQLTRDARGIRFIELFIHRVRAEVGWMERHQRQVTRPLLLAGARAIGDDTVQ